MKNRLGGLARRVRFIQQKSKQANGSLIVDAGNLFIYRREFLMRGKQLPQITPKNLARADLIATIYENMKVAGIAVGAMDLALGTDPLKALARKHKLPLLSANLQTTAGRRIFPAHRVVTVAGVRFGLFGLTGTHRIYKNLVDPAKYKLADPIATAKAEVKALKAMGAKVVIALAAIGDAEARKLADAVPGIQFVFVSGTGRHRPTLEKHGSAYLTEMTREGKYIGYLTLNIRGNDLTFQDASQRFVVAENLKRLEKSRESIMKRSKLRNRPNRGEWMQRRLQRLDGSLARLRIQLHQANQAQPKGSYVTNVLVPCKVTLPEDPATKTLITERAKAAQLVRSHGAH